MKMKQRLVGLATALLVLTMVNMAFGAADPDPLASESAATEAASTDSGTVAASAPPIIPAVPARAFSRKGADTCLKCHDETSAFPVMALFKTPHGALVKRSPAPEKQAASEGASPDASPDASKGSSDSGHFLDGHFLDGQCEACHGPVGEHDKKRLRKGEQRQAMLNFSGQQAEFGVSKINGVCTSCHQGELIGHWQGSQHQQSDVSCTACHSIHVVADPIKKPAGQLAKCGSCHAQEKRLSQQFSHHPLTEGKMACTDCHRPHDSNQDHLLKGDTVNETCHSCHADKRGPFLFEHEPVTEDCTTCHNPHGSNQVNLLTQRPPFLCQQCHGSEGHSAFTPTSSNIGSLNPSAFSVGKSCTNCHSAVHGSNHPSGNKLQR